MRVLARHCVFCTRVKSFLCHELSSPGLDRVRGTATAGLREPGLLEDRALGGFFRAKGPTSFNPGRARRGPGDTGPYLGALGAAGFQDLGP